MNLKLVALLGALTLITPALAMADPWQGPYAGYGYSQNDQGDDDRDGDRDDRGGRGHNCVNPAGHERGWCKNHRNRNCNNNYNGYPNNGQYPYPNNGQYPYPNNGQYNGCYGNNGYNGYNGYGQNATIRGVITGVNGNTITILQGLNPVSIDASVAFQYGRVNGSLYPSRSITAQGYYDQNGYFHATMIS